MKIVILFLIVKLQHVLTKDGDDADDDDKDGDDDDDDGAVIAEGLMNCLIQYKHHPMMDEKCRCGIEHHQLVSSIDCSNEYSFSQPFNCYTCVHLL